MKTLVKIEQHEKLLQQNLDKLFDYNMEDWFSELTNAELGFLVEYIDLHENKPQQFLTRLANDKEQYQRFKFFKKVEKGLSYEKKREQVEQFFKQISMERFVNDLVHLAEVADYEVRNHVAYYALGKLEGNLFTPFEESALQDGELYISVEGEEEGLTIQAVLYFIFMNMLFRELDEKRVIGCKCDYEEALFAYSYLRGLQDDGLSSYLINSKGSAVTTMLFVAVAFSKALRFLNDALAIEELEENEQFLEETMEQIAVLTLKRQHVLAECQLFYLKRKVKKLEQRENQQLTKQTELQRKIEKEKQKNGQQEEKYKQLKQELEEKASALTKALTEKESLYKGEQYTEEIASLKRQLKEAKDALKDEKKQFVKEQESLQNKYDEQEKEKTRLIGEVSLLKKQWNDEQCQKIETEELTFARWLAKGPELLQGMTVAEEEELKQFMAMAEDLIKERSLARPKTELATNRIGYCRVGTDGCFINFGDQQWHEIQEVPSIMYMSDGQFIEVTKDFVFVEAFPYYHSEGPADYAIAHFVAVEDRYGEPFAKVNGQTLPIKYRDNAYVKDRQIISINAQNEQIGYYQHRLITLDDLLPAIQLKGHEPLYVRMALTNGYILRNLKEEERFEQLTDLLLAHSFIILDEDGQVNYTDASGQLFKRSNAYNKKQLASISETEEGVYVLKSDQEYVQLQDIPYGITFDLGDVVWVDEFNRFIERCVEEEEYVSTDSIEKRLLESGRKVTRKTTKEQTPKNKSLLIIGNVRISERYKNYFGGFGYEVEVVDGTGPFEKIRHACSKDKTILYSTTFTSHRNSGKMDKEITIPYILCHSTAPKVMQQALERHA